MGTMKTKADLKDVFVGISTIYGVKNGISLATGGTITPDFDLPVTVDNFKYNQAAPTLNETKIHGMDAAWCVTSTPGSIDISVTIPSTHKDLMEMFFGASTALTGMKIGSETTPTYAGFAIGTSSKKVEMGFALMNESADKLFVISKGSLYASLVFENGSTAPIGINLTGKLESDGSGTDLAFLDKSAV